MEGETLFLGGGGGGGAFIVDGKLYLGGAGVQGSSVPSSLPLYLLFSYFKGTCMNDVDGHSYNTHMCWMSKCESPCKNWTSPENCELISAFKV